MPEYRYAVGRITESAVFITREMKEFEEDYSSVTWEQYQQDFKKQKLVDRTVENILNALIEISGAILAEEGKVAESYAETLRQTAQMFGLQNQEASHLAKLASPRNRLVHRYLDMKWQAITAYKEQVKNIHHLLTAILDRESKKAAKEKK